MRRMSWAVAVVLTIGVCLGPWSESGEAGGEKKPWKSFLPAKAYEELSRRGLERIGPQANENTLRAEALLLAGYALSTKEAPHGRQPKPAQAFKLAELAAHKESAEAAKQLAAKLAAGKDDVKDAAEIKSWREAIGDIGDVMNVLRSKAKGGEGIAPELQYNTKLKKQNGIEALLVALSTKILTDANVGKMTPELELLGYRVATIGALTVQSGPGKKNRHDVKQWDEQAVAMRDAAVELAQGAHQKNGAAVFAASKRLMNTCVECHSNFK